MEPKKAVGRPKVASSAEEQLERAKEQIDAFDDSIKKLTMDRMNEAPKQDVEPQTKLSQKELDKSQDIYLKPERSISSREPFNENYRANYEFDKEYVNFIAEHKELIGETIEMWTKPYAGMPAEFWKVPTNRPVWGPRYVAEQIRSKSYHRLVMQQTSQAGADQMGTYYGSMVADTTIPRLSCEPVTKRRSIFMGSGAF